MLKKPNITTPASDYSSEELTNKGFRAPLVSPKITDRTTRHSQHCKNTLNTQLYHVHKGGLKPDSFHFISFHTIISLSGAELLTSLHSHYLNLLQIEDSSYSAKSLCDKILKAYPTSLSRTKENNKSGIVIYHNSISEESAIRKANFGEHAVKETASYLRSVILKEQYFELPHPLNADALGKGQAKTPQTLLDFFIKFIQEVKH